jgi:hypothetical protein
VLDADENIDVTGTLSANAGGNKYADGGDIHIDLGGDFRVASTGVVSATGVSGGSGGRLYVYPWGGATMDGKLLVDGAGPDATGGDIGLYPSKAVGSAGTWSANGGNGPSAYGGMIDVAIDHYAGGASFISTNALSMRATAGGGGQGGDILVEASADVTVRGKLDVSAGGNGSQGGWISVGTGGIGRGTVSVAGTLDATSSAGAARGADGSIRLIGCDVVVSGTMKANAHTDGQNAVLYTGSLVVTPTGKLQAGSVGGNLVQCSCSGVNVAKGTCTVPNACVKAPTKQAGATVAPAWRLQPIALSPCTCFDAVKNGTETDVGCGGPACAACDQGRKCLQASDCRNQVCTNGTCQAATCGDGVLNQNESAVDCGGPCTGCANGRPCRAGSDCLSTVCQDSICRAPGCANAVKSGTETDVDCGGGACAACDLGKTCLAARDCKSQVCKNGRCEAPSCTDGSTNGTETDVDCGGACPDRCDDDERCRVDTDCASRVCDGGVCQAPTCTDRATNGKETDLNCGGGLPCPACGDGQLCNGVDANCQSLVCDQSVCQEPTCVDRARNGDETDLNCGGLSCAKCQPNQTCAVPSDCTSGVCSAAGTCQWPTCTDGVTNGDETNLNCGGRHRCDGLPLIRRYLCLISHCDGCGVGKRCVGAADCADRVCQGGTCREASCNDTVRNGAETDVNCGGSVCGACADGKLCDVGTDCQSKICDSGYCAAPYCRDGVQNGAETARDCGGGCDGCAFGSPCGTGSDCLTGACTNGACTCAAHDFTFTVQSSRGGSSAGAAWPGGQETKALAPGCDVTAQLPDRRVDRVCSLGAAFKVVGHNGFTRCEGRGGDDGDGCGNVSCPIASYGSCCWNRPSCTSALNGTASADFYVRCE